jgi:hypothetical protein
MSVPRPAAPVARKPNRFANVTSTIDGVVPVSSKSVYRPDPPIRALTTTS